MKIEMTERELNIISNNVIRQVARLVDKYIDEMDESDEQTGVFFVEKSDLVDSIMKMEVELRTIMQPLPTT